MLLFAQNEAPLIKAAFGENSNRENMRHTAVSLVNLGSELMLKLFENESEAVACFDAAHALMTSVEITAHVWSNAQKRLVAGHEAILASTKSSSTFRGTNPQAHHPLDLYEEDECDVGPRTLNTPVFYKVQTANNSILLEAIILFNKGLVFQHHRNVAKARQLYEVVARSIQNKIGSLTSSSPLASMELAMRTYNNLGLISYAEHNEALAKSSFETALHFAKQLSDFSNDYCLEYANVLSNWCRTCWMNGDRNEFFILRLREVLSVRCRILPWDHPDVAASRYNVAVMEYFRRNIQNAQDQLHQYLEITKYHAQCKNVSQIDAVPALILFLLIQYEDKDTNTSQELVRALRTLQAKRQDLGPNALEVAIVLNFVATLLFHLQQYEHALVFFLEELRIEDNCQDEDKGADEDKFSTSVTQNNIGRILQELGRLHESIFYYKLALKGARCTKNDSDQGPAGLTNDECISLPSSSTKSETTDLFSTIWYNIALIQDKFGKYSEATKAFKMSLSLRRTLLGPNHSDIACLLYNIGVLQLEQSLLNDASDSFKEALHIRRINGSNQLKDQHVMKTLQKLACLYKTRGNSDKALDVAKEILAIQEASKDYDASTRLKEVGMTLHSVAELCQDCNDLDQAAGTAVKSVAYLRAAVQANKLQTEIACTEAKYFLFVEYISRVEHFASSLLLLGSLYHELAEPIKATQVLREAAAVVSQAMVAGDFCQIGSTRSTLSALHGVTAMLAMCHCAATA